MTGKYRKENALPNSVRADSAKARYFNEHGWKILSALDGIANQRKKTISQIALAWLISKEVVTSPIIGPRTLEQLGDNLGATDFRLSEEEIINLDKISDWRSI